MVQTRFGVLCLLLPLLPVIFLSILFLKDESGQIFADLAFTISVTVCLSLIVALSVVPTFSFKLLTNIRLHD